MNQSAKTAQSTAESNQQKSQSTQQSSQEKKVNQEKSGASEQSKSHQSQTPTIDPTNSGAADQKDGKDAKIAELTNDLKRLQAEFENYKKRTEKENAQFREFAKTDLIQKLLSVIDSMEMGLKNTQNHEHFVKGMELVYSQLYAILQDEGLCEISTENKSFDPYYHEALMVNPTTDEKQDNKIVEVFQKGYTLKSRVLRHSKVKVSKK